MQEWRNRYTLAGEIVLPTGNGPDKHNHARCLYEYTVSATTDCHPVEHINLPTMNSSNPCLLQRECHIQISAIRNASDVLGASYLD